MRPFTPLLLLHILLSFTVQAQQAGEPHDGRLLFPSLFAGSMEPRIGAIWKLQRDALQLDIGTSVDLLSWTVVQSRKESISAGADAYIWTALRQESNFHFPVEAVDYLFGINVNYARDLDNDLQFQGRLRIGHVSAHLVDGSFDKESMQWRNGQLPRVYSKEFIDMTAATEYLRQLRAYAGFTYLYHKDPMELGAFEWRAGAELRLPEVFTPYIHPFLAYQVEYTKLDAFAANHCMSIGIELGEWKGRGIRLMLNYYDGRHIHGEYYDRRVSYTGAGFALTY